MSEPKTIPTKVIEAIKRYSGRDGAAAWNTYGEIIDQIKWDSMNGCYFFLRHGMYHGVETDGHIHT